MICKECGKEMLIDDKETFFKGCVDKYWYCENCNTTCLEKIRYNQSFKEQWTVFDKENDVILKEYSIKHRINITQGNK